MLLMTILISGSTGDPLPPELAIMLAKIRCGILGDRLFSSKFNDFVEIYSQYFSNCVAYYDQNLNGMHTLRRQLPVSE